MLSESGGSVLGDLPYLGSTLLVSLVIASLASSVLLRKLQTRLATLGCVLLVSGMVLSFAAGMFEANASELRLLSDVAQGGGIGVFFIAWGCIYIRSEAEAVECAFLGWFPLLAALLAVVAGINMLEWGATVLYSCLLFLLPPASLVCFFKSVRHADGHDEEAGLLDGCSRGKEGRPASRGNIVWPLANLVFVFAATSLAWNAFLFRMKINFGAQVAMFAVGIVALFVIVWLALRMTRHFSLSTLYRWALPLLAVGAVLYQFSATAFIVPVFLCLSIVNTGFEVMGKLLCIYIAKRNPRHALAVIAIGFAAASMGGILGSSMWAGVLDHFGADAAGNTLLVALVAFVLAASFALGRDYDNQGGLGASAPPLQRGETKRSDGDQRFGVRDEDLAAGNSTLVVVDEFDANGCVSEEDGHAASVTHVIAAGSSDKRSLGDEIAAEDRVTARCAAMAEQYGLSSREFEVLLLLSQGRSRAHIREALYISKGTVDSHIHHIYSKMGIASKDELMRRLLD